MTGIKRKSSRLLSLLVSFAIAASIFTGLVPGASLTVYAASPYSSGRVRISDVSTGDIISKNCQIYKNNTKALEIYDSDGTTLLNSYGTSGFINNVQPGYDTIATQGGNTVKLKKLDPQTAVTSVSLDQSTLDLTAGGDTATLVATVVANYDLIKTVKWSSSDAAVATVSNGVVTPVSAGTATIKATSGWDGTKYAECAVTVRGSVTISGGANATVSGGGTTQNDLTGAMTTVTYTANSGCIFPAESDYYTTTNGITVSRTSDTVVEVAGTPTSNVNITVPDAVANVDKTSLNDAITAAETLYNGIKDNTDYTEIANTLKSAIDTAKAVAESNEADQAAVDSAAAAITTAKTDAVVGMINALPAASGVTTSDKDTIEAVRATFDSLSDMEKEKVDPDTLKKLTDAEAALAEALHVHELVPKSGKEATCTEDGYKAYYECSGCHKLFSDAEGKNRISAPEVIKKLGHSLKLVEEKAPTKTEPGVRKHYECERCHKLFSDAEGKTAITNDDIVIPVMIHDLTAVSAKAPTCTEDGHKAHYECKDTDCGCSKLYEDKYGEHETTYDKVKILATGHSLEKVNAKAATCTEKGNIEYWKCTKCGKLFKDADGKEEITAEATVTAALGHDKENLIHHPAVAAGHDEEGSKEYYECPKCHKKFSDPECENEITEAEIVVPPVGYAKLGEIYEVGDFKYQITNPKTNGTGTVTLIGVINKTASVSIPKTVNIKLGTYKVNRIGPKAFYGNKTIKKLHIGDNVETIDASAFYGCSKLTKVSGGKVLKTIGKSAFAKCSKLKSFSITSTSLRTIGAYVFKKDKKLKTLNIKRTTKLTKSGVKKALKGSKISIVKVKRSKVKTYKKFFKVSNSGRRVKVR